MASRKYFNYCLKVSGYVISVRLQDLHFKREALMTTVTVTLRPEHMADILAYAVDENSNLYTELVRNSTLSPSSPCLNRAFSARQKTRATSI